MNALKMLPNGTVYFQNTLSGEKFFPCDRFGNFQDVTLNSLGYIEFVRPIAHGQIQSLDGFFQKVSDRLFRDLPKAIVNSVTSPFTAQPIYQPEDFQDARYGSSAGSVQNNRIVGTAGKLIAAVVLPPTAAANFIKAGTTVTSMIQRNQSPESPNAQALQTQDGANARAQQSGFLDNLFPASVDQTTRKVIVYGGGGLLLATTLYFLLRE